MSYDRNIVSTPEKYGLEFVGSLELDDEPWQFYIVAVLKDEKGYYVTTDSGCSCPSPFENHMSREDATGPLTAKQTRAVVRLFVEDSPDATDADAQFLYDLIK